MQRLAQLCLRRLIRSCGSHRRKRRRFIHFQGLRAGQLGMRAPIMFMAIRWSLMCGFRRRQMVTLSTCRPDVLRVKCLHPINLQENVGAAGEITLLLTFRDRFYPIRSSGARFRHGEGWAASGHWYSVSAHGQYRTKPIASSSFRTWSKRFGL